MFETLEKITDLIKILDFFLRICDTLRLIMYQGPN